MAEQKADAYKKKQEELHQEREKERVMLSGDDPTKDKLTISFIYEPLPGVGKHREQENNEPEYKFEWQRKYNAPLKSYSKAHQEIHNQPFGIQAHKYHKWGHINTECPARSLEAGSTKHQLMFDEDVSEDSEASFLKSLTKTQRRALLKKWKKLEKKSKFKKSREVKKH